jgi:hypothetical protein
MGFKPGMAKSSVRILAEDLHGGAAFRALAPRWGGWLAICLGLNLRDLPLQLRYALGKRRNRLPYGNLFKELENV